MWLDRLSDFFAVRRGMLPLLGIGLVILNFVFELIPIQPFVWLAKVDLLLHLGVILGIFGLLLSKAIE